MAKRSSPAYPSENFTSQKVWDATRAQELYGESPGNDVLLSSMLMVYMYVGLSLIKRPLLNFSAIHAIAYAGSCTYVKKSLDCRGDALKNPMNLTFHLDRI